MRRLLLLSLMLIPLHGGACLNDSYTVRDESRFREAYTVSGEVDVSHSDGVENRLAGMFFGGIAVLIGGAAMVTGVILALRWQPSPRA